MKVIQKLNNTVPLLVYFASNEFLFTNLNVQDLREKMSYKDQELFQFDATKIEWHKYFYLMLIGGRRYILKEPSTNLKDFEFAIKKMDVLYYVHNFILLALIYYLGRGLFFVYNSFMSFVV